MIITRTIIDRKLTPVEETEARQFVSERMAHMVYIDQTDPNNIVCHWTNLDVANELIEKTASYTPPLITVIVSK